MCEEPEARRSEVNFSKAIALAGGEVGMLAWVCLSPELSVSQR